MIMSYGKTIELFLPEGTADGLVTAELSNWNGKAIKIPRIEVTSCKRQDINGAGVYFLFCKDEEEYDAVYIGESETVRDRLIQHIKDFNSDKEKYEWNTALIFLGRDLNKTLIRYLENKLVRITKECGRFTVLTKNTYANTVIKESQVASMEEFIDNVKILTNTLGYKLLEPKVIKSHNSHLDNNEYFIDIGEGKAKGIVTSEGFVLLNGSQLNEKVHESAKIRNVSVLRKKLEQQGKIENLKTKEDIVFSSSSAAAKFVVGYSVSGPAVWKNNNGESLKQVESHD